MSKPTRQSLPLAHQPRQAAPIGRPSKRTPEITQKLAESIALGLTNAEACALAGIHPDTLTEWLKDEDFSGAIKASLAQRITGRLKRVEAGDPGWQATAWILERLHPKRFSRPEVILQRNEMHNEFNIKLPPEAVAKLLDGV